MQNSAFQRTTGTPALIISAARTFVPGSLFLYLGVGEAGRPQGLLKGQEVVVVDGKDSSTLVSALTHENATDAAGASKPRKAKINVACW